jgi:hypothetical protein
MSLIPVLQFSEPRTYSDSSPHSPDSEVFGSGCRERPALAGLPGVSLIHNPWLVESGASQCFAPCDPSSPRKQGDVCTHEKNKKSSINRHMASQQEEKRSVQATHPHILSSTHARTHKPYLMRWHSQHGRPLPDSGCTVCRGISNLLIGGGGG